MRFETGRSAAALSHYCKLVSRMKPGECIDIPRLDLMEISSYEHNEALFAPADRVLGNIMGSAYTHSYAISPDGQKVTFMRHQNTGQKRHGDPDDDYRIKMLRERHVAFTKED